MTKYLIVLNYIKRIFIIITWNLVMYYHVTFSFSIICLLLLSFLSKRFLEISTIINQLYYHLQLKLEISYIFFLGLLASAIAVITGSFDSHASKIFDDADENDILFGNLVPSSSIERKYYFSFQCLDKKNSFLLQEKIYTR